MDLDTKMIATLMDTNLFEPRVIVLDLRDDQKWMYFTDWGFKHGIFLFPYERTTIPFCLGPGSVFACKERHSM